MSIVEQILVKCVEYEKLYDFKLEHESIIYVQTNEMMARKSARKGRKCELPLEVQQELEPGKRYLETVIVLKNQILELAKELVIKLNQPMMTMMMKSGPSGIILGLRAIVQLNNEDSEAAARVLKLLFS